MSEVTRRRPWLQTQKGQVMITFALSALVLFALMGLAIDAGISYFHSDLQQRAASAAALSGVSYLPGNFTEATVDADQTASRDGYTNGSNATVTVTQPAQNQLEVAITAEAPTYFMELFGFGEHQVTSYATAEYLPPIQLGQPGSQLGSQLGTCTASGCTGGLGQAGTDNFYFLRTEGWGDPRSEGDGFTPTPTESADSCTPAASCTADPADVHQISCIDGTDFCNGEDGMELNDTGGYNYLIYVPAGTTADLQVYNPAFDPGNDDNCDSATDYACLYSLHDDDGSFPELTSSTLSSSDEPATDWAAMGYSLYAVTQLYSRSADVPLLQDVFCPFDAYSLDTGGSGYSYYAAKSGSTLYPCDPSVSTTPTAETGTGTPAVWHAWTSLLSFPSSASSATGGNLFDQTYTNTSGLATYGTEVGGVYYLSGGSATGGGQYFRLRVDTLAWNGATINTTDSTDSPAVNSSSTSPDGYPYSHAGYSLRTETPSGGSGDCSSSTSGDTCTVSAMGDMCIYTPISGATATSFQVPLFYLPTSYAGKIIQVSIFDPGDVGGGDAYLGIYQPSYSYTSGGTTYNTTAQFASLFNTGTAADPSYAMYNLGTSLQNGDTGTQLTPTDPDPPTGVTVSASSAEVQTSDGSGTAIYNGQWVEFEIQVPSNYTENSTAANPGYWNLFYQVASSAYAGDTITVEVNYLGSPVHLLPNP